MKKVIVKAVVKLADITARYSATKASGWYHYQPKEPKSLNQKKEES